jgi:lipopolysaccharide biosynthesis regulator YciM
LIEPYLKVADTAGKTARANENLRKWAESYQGISLVLKLTDLLMAEKGAAEATRFLANSLNSKPSVRGLDRLFELRSAGHLPAESSDDILKAVSTRLLARQPSYRCSHCGFSGQTHHWQCPSCRHWDTTQIIHGVLGE